jgi:hypothetical protein
VVLYALTRAVLVLALADVFFYGEELAKGAVAVAMLGDVGLPHAQLAYQAYEGGGFVFSHLDALAFLAVGKSLLALKLAAVAWNALTLCAGFLFCDRIFGRRAAVLFALFFIFAPAGFQKLSLLALGIHFEALLFVILVLHFASRVLFEPDASRWVDFALGACAGFGFYFSYSCAVPIGVAALALLVFRRDAIFSKRGLALLVGLLAGLAPLLWMASQAGSSVFDVHGEKLLRRDESMWALFREHVEAIFAGRGVFALAVLACTPAVAALGWIAAWRQRGNGDFARRVAFVTAMLVAFLAVYLASGFAEPALRHWFHLKRLSQAWLFATILVAAFLAHGMSSPRRAVRSAAIGAAALLVAGGALDTLSTASAAPPRSLASSWRALTSLKGYEWSGYVRVLEPRIAGDRARKLLTFARLPESQLGYLDPYVSARLWTENDEAYEEVLANLRSARGDRVHDLLRGLGAYWRSRHGPNFVACVDAASALPADERAPILEAIGRVALEPGVTKSRLRQAIAQGLAHGFPDEYFLGIGQRMTECFVEDVSQENPLTRRVLPWILHGVLAESFASRHDPRVAALLREGFARAVADASLP